MPGVPEPLVHAAITAARAGGREVADVPLTEIARAAGMSRSTLLRRIGGTRAALDDAVRAAGVDPGGRPPVRERAVDVAAELVASEGLAALTLDRLASAAGCSVPSVHEAIGNRDAVLAAVFARYVPLLDLAAAIDAAAGDPGAAVRGVYRTLIHAFEREPRVLPALFADAFSRPDGPASRAIRQNVPNALATLGAWLATEMDAGRFRSIPLPLAMQQLLGPLALHMLTRPVLGPAFGPTFPSADEACETFATNFLTAMTVAHPREETR
jgi:AcrR family transcriptional regulator